MITNAMIKTPRDTPGKPSRKVSQSQFLLSLDKGSDLGKQVTDGEMHPNPNACSLVSSHLRSDRNELRNVLVDTAANDA